MTLQLVAVVDRLTKNTRNCDYTQLSEDVKAFSGLVKSLSPSITQCVLPMLITPYITFHCERKAFSQCNEEFKISILNVLECILKKTKIDNMDGFGLLFDFLLTQIFRPKTNNNEIVMKTSEEYKLSVLSCISAMFAAISFEILADIYTEKQAARMSVLLYTCMDFLRKEKSRELRLNALECIMKCTQVDDSQDMDDVVLLSDIAKVFIKFLPGIASGLVVIAVDDPHCGHKIVQQCVKAWSRLVSMLLREYNPTEEVLKLEDLIKKESQDLGGGQEDGKSTLSERQLCDKKLGVCAILLKKLAAYDHVRVKQELGESCRLLCRTCFTILPQTIPKIIEILLTLSQDDHPEVSKSANEALDDVISQLSKNHSDILSSKTLVDNLHESFHEHITKIPMIFNGVDANEQLTAMNLLTGYLKLFATTDSLQSVLLKQSNLDRLIAALMCVAAIEKNASLLEEYTLHDWENTPDVRTPWKTFKCNDKYIYEKITIACHLLVRPVIIDIVLDYLLEVYTNDWDRKAEATLVINELLSGKIESHWVKTKTVINIYLEDANWKLNLTVDEKNALKDVQNNIVQICLQLEGMGKLALAAGEKFQNLLLKVLYIVLEKAGCNHPMLQAAGLASIANISKACGYCSVTELINKNADYFAYNVTNKLRRSNENPGVLNVLAVVMQYTDMDVLPSISDIIEGVLLQSFNKFQERNAFAYLQVFAIFIKSMHKWLKIEVVVEAVVTKKEKEDRLEAERRLKWEELSKPMDLSDDMMGQTADEMWEEDMQKQEEELLEDPEETYEAYKKPTPPKHIQLIVNILERALNFLPAKEANCKILVLEILKSGVEILKEFEDELLPIVHKIWSPLVNRFKEIETPLIVNCSFSLLSTLGRLSKDFIRMRTVKELLPTLNDVLLKQSKESYLKDRGAAYRYTQGYKMQVNLLEGLPRLAYDLELDDKVSLVCPGVEMYLSCKQPVPLQELAVGFFRQVAYYDPTYGNYVIEELGKKYQDQIEWCKNVDILCSTIVRI